MFLTHVTLGFESTAQSSQGSSAGAVRRRLTFSGEMRIESAARAANAIVVSPEAVKRRRNAPAEEPCDDCAVDAKPSVT